jgi:predicted metalloprotease with PDZ domain
MKSATSSNGVVYQVAVADLHAHLFSVTLTFSPHSPQTALRLPVWIPGSYLVREFSKNLQKLTVRQGKNRLTVTQQDKATWQIECVAGQELTVVYEVYALDNSVRTAWLDASRGFFNGTSLFLQVEGQEDIPHTLLLEPNSDIAHWSLATGLSPVKTDKQGFGSYQAEDYDTLVDSPVEMGTFWSGSFKVQGVPHRFVVAGAPPSFDGKQLLSDTRKICEEGVRFWGNCPVKSYLFMLNAVGDGYGGLEHRNSTALICTRKDLPRLPRTTLAPTTHRQPDGYTTLLGLISHEYFHTWNVKRLRPAEFARYDYTRENHTQLLWFFEGFTSYYDDLLLRRAQLLDNASYLKLLSKTINQVCQTPGRKVQSVAQASFDAWVKYYRQDENTPNATVSYYTKGALVALCLDLTLRAQGKTDLDEVMRSLWTRCAGGPMQEQDLLLVLEQLSGSSHSQEIAQWVHSTTELPFAELLETHGIQVNREPDQIAQQLGVRVKEGSNGLHIHQVLRGGAAEQAGFASGDEWIAVENTGSAPGPWRMMALDDLTLYSGKAKTITAWVSRDKLLLKLPLKLPAPSQAVRLSVRDKKPVDLWLDR